MDAGTLLGVQGHARHGREQPGAERQARRVLQIRAGAMDENRNAAERFSQLPPRVQLALSRMNDDEAASLEYVVTIPKEELRAMMKSYRDMRAVSRFIRWAIFGIIATFLAAVAFGESVIKVIGWFRDGFK
jgi:hypothetical protein